MAFITNFFSNMFEANDEENEREQEFSKKYHRYDSFAPVRHDAKVKYFIDGHDYCWYSFIYLLVYSFIFFLKNVN